MSHAGGWHAACRNRISNPWFRFGHREEARGVTDPGVGSGALLGESGTKARGAGTHRDASVANSGHHASARMVTSPPKIGAISKSAAESLLGRMSDCVA